MNNRPFAPACTALPDYRFWMAWAWFVAACILGLSARVSAQEAPDTLIRRAVGEVTAVIDADRDIQAGDRRKITALVNARVLPYLNLEAMTRSALGRHWPRATAGQQQALTREFGRFLVNTYSGALTSYRPGTVIEYRPTRMDGNDAAVVRSLVKVAGGDPIQLDYYLERADSTWKVVDINVLGARLVETYKGQFAASIAADGIDGLIKALASRNKAIEERSRA
jgi:phospholipid transport system substrate-binding protein